MRKIGLLMLCSLAIAGPHSASSAERRGLGFAPTKEQPIAIEEFTLEDAEINYAGAYEMFGMDLAESMSRRFDALGFEADAIERGESPSPGTVLVTGRFIKLDRGNAVLRYFFGFFGAGKAWVAVAGEVRDARGTKVAQFSTKRYSASIFGGGAERSVRRCLEAVASEVVNMVRHGSYRQLMDVALDQPETNELPVQLPASSESEPEALPFSACFDHCLELTDRTREECFDACSGR